MRVLPAVPREARRAYCVAVYVLSTSNEINVTKATVANAAARSSRSTVAANNNSDLSDHAIKLNIMFVMAIAIPDRNKALTTPDLIANHPPNQENVIVVLHPRPFE